MRDRSDRFTVQGMQPVSSSTKKIGGYLLDAGLLTTDQINVVLNDQQATGMRFGEIVVARGWIKEQTVEWIMTKVVEPERRATQPPVEQPRSPVSQAVATALPPVPVRPVAQPAAPPRIAASAPPPPAAPKIAAKATELSPQKTFVRRDAPISKPLPSVNSADSDVNWVG